MSETFEKVIKNINETMAKIMCQGLIHPTETLINCLDSGMIFYIVINNV